MHVARGVRLWDIENATSGYMILGGEYQYERDGNLTFGYMLQNPVTSENVPVAMIVATKNKHGNITDARSFAFRGSDLLYNPAGDPEVFISFSVMSVDTPAPTLVPTVIPTAFPSVSPSFTPSHSPTKKPTE